VTGSGFESDAAAMTRAVQGFETSSNNAKQAMSSLESELQQATARYQGSQAVAFKALHARIDEDMVKARQELVTMSELVNASFRNYSSADETVASSLQSVANAAGGHVSARLGGTA
jgi:WXG100 family type VII secretion target